MSATPPSGWRVVNGYWNRPKNSLPAPIGKETELLTTPGTGCQFGAVKLAVALSVSPVAEADHEIVTLPTERLMVRARLVNDQVFVKDLGEAALSL